MSRRNLYVAAAVRGALLGALFAFPVGLLLAVAIRALGLVHGDIFPISVIVLSAAALWIGDRLLQRYAPPRT